MRAGTLACLAATVLAGCAHRPDLCKHAPVRRSLYVTTIAVADAYVASGRPVPPAVTLGREAAITALAVLNVNCPVVGVEQVRQPIPAPEGRKAGASEG